MLRIHPHKPELVAEEVAIVLIGDFNPKIYQPAWFASQELVRESEAETANIELIHSDFTSFSTDWFVLQVARDRFTVTVKSAAFKRPLQDLVSGTFAKLSHTPMTQMGINATTRLRFKSGEDWHAFGHFLVPKSHWAPVLAKPGTRSVTIEGPRDDDRAGRLLIVAEPVHGTTNEAVIRVNDHYEQPAEKSGENAAYFLEVLGECYDNSLSRAKNITDRLVETYLDQDSFDDGSTQ